MTRKRLVFAAACALISVDIADAGPLDEPKPEVFARAEDRERARLLRTPCTIADIGRGCYRFDNRLLREGPCAYHIDARTIGSLRTDQCYKMDRPRRYRGVWINEFEGQQFIPEGTTPPEWPRTDPRSRGSRAQADRAQATRIWLTVNRAKTGGDISDRNRKMLIEFIGRKTAYPGSHGHFAMSGAEIIVDRVISLEKLD